MHSGGETQGRDVRQKDFCSAGSAFCNCFVIDDCPLLYMSVIWARESKSRGWVMGSSHGGIWLCTSQRGFRKMDLNIFLNHLLYGFYISELLFLDSKQIPDRVLVLSTKWWSSVSLHGNPSFIVPSFIAQWEEEDDCRNKVGSWHLGLCEAEYLVLGMDWLLGASANFYN